MKVFQIIGEDKYGNPILVFESEVFDDLIDYINSNGLDFSTLYTRYIEKGDRNDSVKEEE